MNRTLVLPLAIALLGGALLWSLLGHFRVSGESDTAGNERITAALALLADQQAAMAARLDRLEGGRSAPAGATRSGAFAAPGTAAQLRGRTNGAPVGQGDVAARTADAMRKLDNDLVSEPVNAFWATNTEGRIDRLLDDRALAKLDLPAPVSMASTCHSKTCRIDLLFDDPADAQQTSLHLFEEIANTLPRADSFYQPGPNGTTKMVIYASGGS